MKRFLFCTVAVIGTFSLAPVRAEEEAMAALKNAEKAQLDAPAFRMKTVTIEANDKSSGMTVEMVKPDLLYWKSDENGQVDVEMWSDGKKAYMRQGAAGQVHESPMDISSLLTQARQVNPLESLITNAKDLKLVGHEDVKGVHASVYIFKSQLMRIDSLVKLWISDADHRPLKSEIETHRELKAAPVHKKTVVTYEYDSSIKVVVPGN